MQPLRPFSSRPASSAVALSLLAALVAPQAHANYVSSLASACGGVTDETPPGSGASANSTSSGVEFLNNEQAATCSARAGANFIDATLRTFADAHVRIDQGTEKAAAAEAAFSDGIVFYLGQHAQPGPYPVTFVLRVTGRFVAYAQSALAVTTDFMVGDELDPVGSPGIITPVAPIDHLKFHWFVDDKTDKNLPVAFDAKGNTVVQSAFAPGLDATLKVSFMADLGHHYVLQAKQLNEVTTLGGDAESDFEHTARLAIEVPDGIGFTTDSGVLFAGAGTPTDAPAPAAWSLLGVALLVGAGFSPRSALRSTAKNIAGTR